MNKKRILVVEDEAVVARDIRQQLTELGYEPLGETRRAEEAIVLSGESRPDLVLMDIHLAGEMDGITAAQIIRDRFSLPVVFLTAFASEPVINRAKIAEPFGYIIKPFDERELRTVIEMALYKHQIDLRQRESHEEQAAITRTTLDGFWLIDMTGRILEVNDACCRMHGFTREEMLGMMLSDFEADEAPAEIGAQIERIMREGSGRFERRHRCKDGSVVELEISTNYRPTFGGRFIAFLRDVTERKRMESALRESESMHRNLVEAAQDMIWRCDVDGRFAFLNDAWETALGYRIEEMLGRSFGDFKRPEVLARDVQEFERCLAGGLVKGYETTYVSKTGAEIHLLFNAIPQRDAEGRVIGVQGTATDITARKRAEGVLQARLRLSDLSVACNLEELLQKTLDEAELLTGSVIGFFHFVAKDQKTLQLQTWSTNTLARMCTAEGKGRHYDIDQAGVWVDCLRERRPVIHNDYAALPYRKGLPPGHAPITRELVVPVLRDGLVVAIFGVGNKPRNYDERDIEALATLANHCWDMVGRKKAEIAQQESDANIEALLNAATQSAFLMDRAGNVLIANEISAQRLGLRREQVVGANMYTLLPDHLAESRRAHVERVCATGQALRFIDQCAGRWLDQNLVPIKDARGSVATIAVFAEDITERKKAEQTLLAHEQKLQRIFQTAPVGIGMANGRILNEVNDGFCSITGYAREEVIGRETRFLYAAEADDEYQKVGLVIGRMFASGLRQMVGTRWRRKDGASIDVEISASPLYDGDQSPALVFAVVDITARNRMEDALRASEERFRMLFNNSNDSILVYVLKPDGMPGRFIEVNDVACARLGYTREELMARSPLDLLPTEFASKVRANLSALMAQKRLLIEAEYLTKSGQRSPVEISAQLFELGGRPTVLSVARDISARKTLETQFRQAQKMEVIGQLAGGVAHDFNNILTAMMLNLELLRSAHRAPEADSPLQELDAMAKRAAKLTQQLLMFARRQAIQVSNLELNGALTNLLKMLRRLLGEHIDLKFVMGAPALWIDADPGMLDQAVMNLCINSRDAMPVGGTLTLATGLVAFDAESARAVAEARPGTFACLQVSDTGCGMSAEVLQHVFEPFFTTKEIGKGTGLGLASVHGIVHQHQGWVNVESAVGRGTTFRLYLPCATKSASADGDAPAAEPKRGGNETILLVEDEEVVRKVSAMMLRKLGYQVLAAANAREALQLWDQHAAAIDLLFTDIVMPGGMTGMELGEKLQRMKPTLQIALMSGYSAEIMKVESQATGAVSFLPKPFEYNSLAATIRKCLDRGRSAAG